ncbi:Myelin and lymphocyte protein [Tupaia chinensis]|uniref:Myelin and lymphocyte protein n=1 Tax=Tupaia chinensis TaxID=246437 RepID=L9JLR3_TUPCH|nr:Myelin and lymphocyte protein [Tupaia chinensis]
MASPINRFCFPCTEAAPLWASISTVRPFTGGSPGIFHRNSSFLFILLVKPAGIGVAAQIFHLNEAVPCKTPRFGELRGAVVHSGTSERGGGEVGGCVLAAAAAGIVRGGLSCGSRVGRAAGLRERRLFPAHTVLVFGGLVWILIASSLVPIPMIQGWVMFVSVFCFVATTTLIVLYMIGAHGGETSWVTLDAGYHCIAALFYLSASVLEALATILMRDGYIYKQYHENISAVVFAYVATLLYVVHAVFSLIRWKSS